jgi:hypothetical protein
MNDPLRQIEAIIDRLDCNDAEFWTALDSRRSALSNAEAPGNPRLWTVWTVWTVDGGAITLRCNCMR